MVGGQCKQEYDDGQEWNIVAPRKGSPVQEKGTETSAVGATWADIAKT